MRSVQLSAYGPPEHLHWKVVPEPEIGPGDVPIRTAASTAHTLFEAGGVRGKLLLKAEASG